MSRNDELVMGVCESKIGIKTVVLETGDKNVYKATCDGQQHLPTVVIREGKEKWNLSKYIYLAVDIGNPGSEDLLVECRLNEIGAITVGSGQIIPAGKTRTIRTYLIRDHYPKYLDKKLYGMFALPGNTSIVRAWLDIHPDSINRFSIAVIHPPKDAAFLIGNLRGEGSFAFLSEKALEKDYFPLLDEFGQFRHKDWPGKTHSLSELVKSKEDEAQDIAANPAPEEWDKYGGWLKGPQLEATGHFRTEKVNGKWWLVDPEGRLFWSHGMSISVLLDEQATPITEREHYFTGLPDAALYKDFYGTQTWIPQGYYKGCSIQVFNIYAWNLYKKYGESWKTTCFEHAYSRLKSWGMNTYYSWSVPTILGMSKIPYAALITTINSRRIEGTSGYWSKFPDPFDKSLSESVKSGLENIKKSTSDPYCIGYFVDNEMDWGDDSYLAKSVIQSGKNQPAKLAMLDFLEKKYDTVDELNTSWQTTFNSWDEFMENTSVPSKGSVDFKAFSAIIAREYFKTVRETLAKNAPHKLYLGCRFHDHYYPNEDTTCDWVVKIAAEYCDVVSFNRYRYSAVDLRPALADKPVIISEWHMGTLDRGLPHYTLRFAESQENRAEMYEYYLKSCLENPFIVGAHWFEYTDEPVTGRFDGENFNTGFVDVCDKPYPEMTGASRKMGKAMYAMRF